MPDVVIRRLNLPADGERLVEMWRASEAEWPGTRSRGVPVTLENLLAGEEQVRCLVWVAEVDSQIVGYCSFMDGYMGHEGEGYISTLNVCPGHQKRSIARRLIQATIDHSVKMGWQRQTLHTWSANFKAVPLYKKTGHYWTPDTAVHMQCFIPGALQLPLARSFFERHDWYRCYVRALAQEADDERWEGIKVFTEHWEARGESLTIWIDREARAPMAVETESVQVATIAQDPEPLTGHQVSLRWRIKNKTQDPIRVMGYARGCDGLQLDYRQAFVVPAGETVEHLVPVLVADGSPLSAEDGSALKVRSILRIGEQEAELFSGLRPRAALALDTDPERITLRQGVEQVVNLQLHSALADSASVALSLVLPQGLHADWTANHVDLPTQGHATVQVRLSADEEAVYKLPLRCLFQDGTRQRTLTSQLTVFSLGIGGLLVEAAQESVRLETDTLRIVCDSRDGLVSFEDKVSGITMLRLSATVGPPYWPSEFQNSRFRLEHARIGCRDVVRMLGESRLRPGLCLWLELSLSASGVGTLNYGLENRTAAVYLGRVRLWVQCSDRQRETMTIPLATGLVRAAASTYPIAWDDAPRDTSQYREPWVAWERAGTVAGIIWGEAVARIEYQWRVMTVDTREWEVAPGQRSTKATCAVFCGPGDWCAVRAVALRWREPLSPLASGQRTRAVATAPAQQTETRQAASARVEPQVLVTTQDQVTIPLVIDTASSRPSNGQVTLDSVDGLALEPPCLPVSSLLRGQEVRQRVTIRLPHGGLGVFRGEAHLTLPLSETATPFAIARLGTQAPVRVDRAAQQGHEVWTIDNGASTLVVAPGFGPSLVAWVVDGINQLSSTFPHPQGIAWTYPWFGGIKPTLLPIGWTSYPGTLHLEEFAAETVTSVDRQGLEWHGVRLTCGLRKEELRDLVLGVEYLTLGQSRVCKFIFRLTNARATTHGARLGCTIAGALGASIADLVLTGEQAARRPNPWLALQDGQRWGALTNPHSGRTLLVAAQQSDLSLQDWGSWGRTLGTTSEIRLRGHETREHAYYAVLADSLQEAQRYRALCDCVG